MINAKIVDAIHDDDQNEPTLDKCQIDLKLDDCPKLLIQFDDLKCWFKDDSDANTDTKLVTKCKSCQELNNMEKLFNSNKDYVNFLNKYNKIKEESNSKDAHFISATKTDLMNTISSLVSCVGCRASLERFYRNQTNKLVKKSFHYSYVIYPFLIKSNETLTLNNTILNNPFKLYSIFNLRNSKIELKSISRLNSLTNTTNLNNLNSSETSMVLMNPSLISFIQIPNCLNSNICNTIQPNANTNTNKNRRCQMHSLDKNRLKSINDWLIVWDAFTKNSTRNKILLIDTSKLMVTLDSYLRRHKFCSDCKLKVIRAYNILIGEVDPTKEKGYCPSLYDGIECCSITNKQTTTNSQNVKKPKFHLNNQHLHLKNDKQFIANLIYKAESEIQCGRRERHAKTLDIAQEEVLTCIGIHLFERFFRIYQSIRLEEQLWQLMVYSNIVTLKKNFELKYEQLQGVSNLELVCAELEAENQKKELKNSKKKTKSGEKKTKNKSKEKKSIQEDEDEEGEFEYFENSTSNSSQGSKAQDDINSETEFETSSKQSSPSTEPSCGCTNDNQLCSFTSLTSSSSSALSSSTHDLNEFSFTSLNNDLEIELDDNDDLVLITDEEKNEYYANKTNYLNERTNRRLLLRERFQNLKLNSSFKLRPRN